MVSCTHGGEGFAVGHGAGSEGSFLGRACYLSSVGDILRAVLRRWLDLESLDAAWEPPGVEIEMGGHWHVEVWGCGRRETPVQGTAKVRGSTIACHLHCWAQFSKWG